MRRWPNEEARGAFARLKIADKDRRKETQMFRKLKNRILYLTLAFALLALAGCGAESGTGGESGTDGESGADGSSQASVTIENCGEEVAFDGRPERAVALDANTAEMMLALGLAERMVGVSGVDEESDVLPELRDDLAKVPERIGDWQPSLEQILGTEPDIVVGGWGNGFYEETDVTPARLGELGIASYTITQTCPDRDSGVSIEDVYTDMQNLGQVFGAEERAEELVRGYEARISEVRSTLPEDAEPPRAFVYDSGEQEAMTAAEGSMANEIVGLAGIENVFEDTASGQLRGWPTVGWEEVVERNPELIVVVDYGETSAEQKLEFLKNNPALEEIEAIREENFATISLTDLSPGVRNAGAVEKLASEAYPEAFASVGDSGDGG